MQPAIADGPHAPTTTLKEAEHLGGLDKVGAKANTGRVYEPHVAEGSFRNGGATDKLKTVESSVEKMQEGAKGVEKLKGGMQSESPLVHKQNGINKQVEIPVGKPFDHVQLVSKNPIDSATHNLRYYSGLYKEADCVNP